MKFTRTGIAVLLSLAIAVTGLTVTAGSAFAAAPAVAAQLAESAPGASDEGPDTTVAATLVLAVAGTRADLTPLLPAELATAREHVHLVDGRAVVDPDLASLLPTRQAATVRTLADHYNTAAAAVTRSLQPQRAAEIGAAVNAMPSDPGGGDGGGGGGRGGGGGGGGSSGPGCGASSPDPVHWWGVTLRFSHCLVNLMIAGNVTAGVLAGLLGLAVLLAPTGVGALVILSLAAAFLSDAMTLLDYDQRCGYRGVDVNITWIIVGTSFSTVC